MIKRRVNPILIGVLLPVAIAALLIACYDHGREPGAGLPAELLVFCGGGLRAVVEELAAEFEETHPGIRLRMDFGASNLLLGKIQVRREGDVFIPGDETYVQKADAAGLILQSATVAAFVPTIMVAKGNPKAVESLTDFARSDLRTGFADERTAAIGSIAHAILKEHGLSRAAYTPAIAFESVTVVELATAIDLGHLDAAIVWEPVARQFSGAETVAIPERENIIVPVPIAILRSSQREAEARRFAEFALSEQGQAVFRRHGYAPPR